MNAPRRRTALTVLALAASLTTGACMSPEKGDPQADPCASMGDSAPGQVTSIDLVLIDRSGSAEAKSNGYVPAWGEGLKALLPIESGADYHVAPFAGGRFVPWPPHGKVVPALTGTTSHREPVISAVQHCLGTTVDRALLPHGSEPGSDILAAMAAAGGRLGASPAKAKRLYVATDGRATSGCAKPSSGHHLTEALMGRTVSACEKSEELPQNLADVSITFVGLGTSSSSVAPVLPRDGRMLADLWIPLCHAMNAKSCTAVAMGLTRRVTPTPAR
jgi:hypothetical protein